MSQMVFARAGGVEMQAGRPILPQKVVEPRQAGIVRRFAGRLATQTAERLHNWLSKFVPQKIESGLRKRDAISDICSTPI